MTAAQCTIKLQAEEETEFILTLIFEPKMLSLI